MFTGLGQPQPRDEGRHRQRQPEGDAHRPRGGRAGARQRNPHRRPAIDEAARRHHQSQVLRGTLTRIKIWDTDGTILYSDETRLIGRKFQLQADDLEALRSGETEAGLSDLSEPENQYEEPAKQLLEVYLPVTTQQGHPMLFEAYFEYSGITEAGRQLWLQFAPFSLGALVLLELLQVPLVLSLARRLRRTQYQREDLLRNALEATQEERRRIAGDLHDGVVQDLAGVAFSLGAAARKPGRDPEDAATVRAAADQVRDGVRSLRSLMVEIYPPNLYDEGLEAALSDLLARLEPRGIETSLRVDAPLDDARHGRHPAASTGPRRKACATSSRTPTRPRSASPSYAERDSVVLEVSDDGRGLPGPDLPQKPGHLGLRALGGLAATMGASLTLSSTPEREPCSLSRCRRHDQAADRRRPRDRPAGAGTAVRDRRRHRGGRDRRRRRAGGEVRRRTAART